MLYIAKASRRHYYYHQNTNGLLNLGGSFGIKWNMIDQ